MKLACNCFQNMSCFDVHLLFIKNTKPTNSKENKINYDVVLRHTLPVFKGLGRCPIISWDFAGAVSIFGPDAFLSSTNDLYQD